MFTYDLILGGFAFINNVGLVEKLGEVWSTLDHILIDWL